ncbi:condensin-2 complex subunit H2 isoform X2 [Haemorhous mexicanus]|uniref:condensin-2 complex subunit H2 isoform X2 n=1 Tax=Haemorhous mexicanus TaxID=30427 RepID=UPI0028BF57F8|nr:condensin-2 complex subunit H2 isoform X2 [Haemorhous mexicanus]
MGLSRVPSPASVPGGTVPCPLPRWDCPLLQCLDRIVPCPLSWMGLSPVPSPAPVPGRDCPVSPLLLLSQGGIVPCPLSWVGLSRVPSPAPVPGRDCPVSPPLDGIVPCPLPWIGLSRVPSPGRDCPVSPLLLLSQGGIVPCPLSWAGLSRVPSPAPVPGGTVPCPLPCSSPWAGLSCVPSPVPVPGRGCPLSPPLGGLVPCPLPWAGLSRVPSPAPARVPQHTHNSCWDLWRSRKIPGCGGHPGQSGAAGRAGVRWAGPGLAQGTLGTVPCRCPRSRRGEVLASRRDFRMNTSTPHASGAFLLELAGLSPTHPQQEQRLGTATAPGSSPAERPSAGTALVRALSFCEEADAAGPDDDDIPGAPLGEDMEVTPVPNEHIVAQRSTPRTRGYMLRERPPSPDPKALSKEEPNPWQSLDPFGDSEEKPFRKGRPFLVPHGLDDVVGGKRKRRGPRKLQDFTRWFSAAYNNVTEGQKTRRKGPTFADLEVLYWRQFKERLAVHRKLQSRGELLREPEPELEQEHGADSEEGADNDFVEHEDMEPEAPEELEEGNLDPPEPGYEELVRRNVELFMASSQKFAQETELSQRIRQWEELVEPLLQEQESRVPFDVRAYGLALTERCAEVGQWHSLASLVAGQPPFEVCRYLLASLQLANDGEVELAQEPGLEAALDTARLRLLSTRPAHERFQHFQLPSQRDPGPQ